LHVDQGYSIGSGISFRLISVENGCCGQSVLVLGIVENNQPRQMRVNFSRGQQSYVNIGHNRLELIELDQVNNRNIVRCYLSN